MSSVSLLTSIVARNRLPALLKIYKEQQLEVNLIALGHGTATHAVLNMLGLDSTERAVCYSFVTEQKWPAVKKDLRSKLRIDVPGTGIAFTIPLSSIGGKRELAFLTQKQEFIRKEEGEMKGTQRELIMIICNQGYNEQVMDAAREAGAAGGTVIHARGTGMQSAEQFFGVSLASEKDIIYIVSNTSGKNRIMQSVMEKAGLQTPAKAVAFSLPVTDTAGLRLLEEDEEEPAPAQEKQS